jgi:acyl-CoA thioesterase
MTPEQKSNHMKFAAWLRARVDKCLPQDLHLHAALLALAADEEAKMRNK